MRSQPGAPNAGAALSPGWYQRHLAPGRTSSALPKASARQSLRASEQESRTSQAAITAAISRVVSVRFSSSGRRGLACGAGGCWSRRARMRRHYPSHGRRTAPPEPAGCRPARRRGTRPLGGTQAAPDKTCWRQRCRCPSAPGRGPGSPGGVSPGVTPPALSLPVRYEEFCTLSNREHLAQALSGRCDPVRSRDVPGAAGAAGLNQAAAGFAQLPASRGAELWLAPPLHPSAGGRGTPALIELPIWKWIEQELRVTGLCTVLAELREPHPYIQSVSAPSTERQSLLADTARPAKWHGRASGYFYFRCRFEIRQKFPGFPFKRSSDIPVTPKIST